MKRNTNLFHYRLLIPSIIIVLAILIVSCGKQNVNNADTSSIPVATTIMPTLTPLVIPPKIYTPIPESTVEPQTQCQEIISSQLQNGFSENGSIIFEGECEGQEGLFKLSLVNQRIEPFVSDNNYGKSVLGWGITPFYVSNDHQWLMYEYNYYDENDNYLGTFMNFVGEDESSLIQYPLDGSWESPMGWYGNKLAGFSELRASDFTMKILSPFSGNVTRFHYEFHGFERAELLFDPPIARALYFDDLESLRYMLKEISTDKILWQSIEDRSSAIFANHPQWSPNGLFFAIPVWDDIDNRMFRFVAVDRNGREIITDNVFRSDDEAHYVGFTWSDGGRYLIFWDHNENFVKRLVIWDVANNQFIESVFTTKYEPGFPVFSPDESQFIVNIRVPDGDDGNKSENYLFDLVSGETVQLNFGLLPVAWLKPFEPGQQTVKPPDEPNLTSPKSGSAVTQQCLEIEDVSKPNSQFSGKLVFSRDRFLYALSPGINGNEVLVDKPQLMDAFVSPNRESLFYWYEDANENFTPHYWLASLDGQRTEVVTNRIFSSYDAIHGWANNQELWVDEKSDFNLFNPFKNTFRDSPRFADPQRAGCIDWYICSGIGKYLPDFYDSSFERMVFVGTAYLSLMDREANTLWQYENWLVTLNIPKWSPDQQKIGVPLPLDDIGEHYEFFTVDRDGKASQLTNYSSAYPVVAIDKFQWSPDGRYVAFWTDTRSKEGIAQRNPYRLFVLDTLTRQTTDYCISGNYANNKAPIWSPEGSQIAVNSVKDGKLMIFIVDFASGIATPVAEGELIGWMTMP